MSRLQQQGDIAMRVGRWIGSPLGLQWFVGLRQEAVRGAVLCMKAVRGAPGKRFRKLKKAAREPSRRTASTSHALRRAKEIDADGLLSRGIDLATPEHALAVVRTGWLAQTDGYLGVLLGAARGALGDHVAAVGQVEDLVLDLLPAPDYDDDTRSKFRRKIHATLLRDAKPSRPEWAAAQWIDGVTDLELGRVPQARSFEDYKRWQGEARTQAQMRVFSPPRDVPNAMRLKGGPAPPQGAYADAWEAELPKLAEDVLGDGERGRHTLRRILWLHREDAKDRARNSADPTQSPSDFARDRYRKKAGLPEVVLADPDHLDRRTQEADVEGQAELLEARDLIREELTKEEWIALDLHLEGASDREIGRQIKVSPKTAKARWLAAKTKAERVINSCGLAD